MDDRPNRSRGPHASTELREQAVRMVFERIAETGEQSGAIARVSRSIGVNRETLRKWVRQTEVDAGERAGLTTQERARLVALERENRDLRRANDILKSAAAFFGAELDRRSPR
jgi:transposase